MTLNDFRLNVAGKIIFLVVLFTPVSTKQASASNTIDLPPSLVAYCSKYCADCHQGAGAEANIDLSAITSSTPEEHFSHWQQIARVVSERQMPPSDADPMSDSDRQAMLETIESLVSTTKSRYASDPGPSVVRRLTSAEFDYCIEDLTGLSLHLGKQFVSDSVGGSGFTNSASAQFMQDATLERYLEAAQSVASHAMIGAGPLYFYDAPGQTGMELSAVNRIQEIYQRYGFRSSAGEGAKPYGLHRFPTAFEVAWQYKHRVTLGRPAATLAELASDANLEPKFARHIWEVLNRKTPSFPLSDVVDHFQAFPSPDAISGSGENTPIIEQHSKELYEKMKGWQLRFAGSASAEEEASVLSGTSITVPSRVNFIARAIRKTLQTDNTFTPDLNNEKLFSKDGRVQLILSVEPASQESTTPHAVIFREPKFRNRLLNVVEQDPVPLRGVLSADMVDALQFGENPGGNEIGNDDFVIRAGESKLIEIELAEDCRVGELLVQVQLDQKLGADSVVRCVIEDVTSSRGKTYSSLLRDPNSEEMDLWESGLSEFASALPQISHREPVPSDRDPIPAPYTNTYNVPERNYFHTAVKYHREDSFLMQHILPAEVASELETAWTDLLTSFDYHNVNFHFTTNKFGVEEGGRTIETADSQWIDSLPLVAREHVFSYKSEFDSMQSALRSAAGQHLRDVLSFAESSWRRPLDRTEKEQLTKFYNDNRNEHDLTHAQAIRATLCRILVSPEFLFRSEKTKSAGETRELSSHELATRLSFSLWASQPDAQLHKLARENRLVSVDVLQQQVERMLRSSKSRRFSTEFFGQWLGFYQFDQFRGVDTTRFPEFNDALKASLYDEAVSFFERIIRENRPYTEIVNADYTIIDQRVAEHYGIGWEEDSAPASSTIVDTTQIPRGGVFGLGAVLTATSAPLRTSPVKRGDWVLRRVMGTPVPPPPADAGSLPADDVVSDGLSMRERLDAHRSRAECMNCHVRIDPLGFALENFDSLGRWRTTYRDGRDIDTTGVTHKGKKIQGMDGLQEYVQDNDDLFRRMFATQLIAYMLGRSHDICDAALLDNVADALEEDPRFSVAVTTIVLSPQFRNARPSTNASTEKSLSYSGARP